MYFIRQRKKRQDPVNDQHAARITDWIQAITVVIGVAIAVWQLVIVDRDSERQRWRAVSDLVLAAQSEQFVSAVRALYEWGSTNKPPDDVLRVRLSPIELHFQAWAFCIANNLCDQRLALDFVCSPLLSWNDLIVRQNIHMETYLFPRGKDYDQVSKECKALSAKQPAPQK